MLIAEIMLILTNYLPYLIIFFFNYKMNKIGNLVLEYYPKNINFI